MNFSFFLNLILEIREYLLVSKEKILIKEKISFLSHSQNMYIYVIIII